MKKKLIDKHLKQLAKGNDNEKNIVQYPLLLCYLTSTLKSIEINTFGTRLVVSLKRYLSSADRGVGLHLTKKAL